LACFETEIEITSVPKETIQKIHAVMGDNEEKRNNPSYYKKKSDIAIGMKKEIVCKVVGCPLLCTKDYESRVRVCGDHLRAERVDIDNQLCRFCQKCTKFEDLECFKGKRRACRASLAKLSSRRKDRLSLISATANTSLTSTTSRDNKEPRKTKTSDREYDMMIASKEEVISDEEERIKLEVAEQLVNIVATDKMRKEKAKENEHTTKSHLRR
jgi:hypothetical protein